MALNPKLDLNSLPLFVALVEAGSFTAAADRLGVNKSKVSLAIQRLEKTLGLALFTRTTRQVQLTPAGERFYQGCQPWLLQMQSLVSEVEADQSSLQGTLRISAPEDYAVQVITPAVVAFCHQHPQLNVELRSGDRVADMVSEGVDLAIRLGWLKDSSLRATRLGHFEQWLVASPDYLRRHGTPVHPDALSDHDWVAFTPLVAPLTWQFRRGKAQCQVKMHSRLKANTTAVTRAMLQAGTGLSVLADSIARPAVENGTLVRVLPDWQLPEGGIHAVYPPGDHVPARVRRFVAFLKDRLAGQES
ncbi:transcriptional regulator PtxR [Alcanivorax hongdengensis A-11-3]|uniref:Transcriptional regulator PtxR n=1 Tax=Alcanivorax hongdengensis A-11-3 TaxID=1177179 RepID=L0WF47_9GAMM|nr:LysR family transcriptional regulator [Alcanivorax hongdengensis]EKF75661.1 transcriptional regulator PtxR [Alcanivorax hongdengensis A-11-3]